LERIIEKSKYIEGLGLCQGKSWPQFFWKKLFFKINFCFCPEEKPGSETEDSVS
jgi:hypothetical protein